MTAVLVDSNVLLDLLTQDPLWCDWSAQHLAAAADRARLVINPIIYAEVSAGFATIELLDAHLGDGAFRRLALPYEAGFIAGRAFVDYRRRGGQRTSPLPDFYIGAHALVGNLRLLTRDAARYRSYFPNLAVVAP